MNKNPYEKTVYNIGCIGNTKTWFNRKQKPSYTIWVNMLKRCYTNRQASYEGCMVCEEWLCYENFEEWYNENYYQVNNERMGLDKDILCKGNKIYSPTTCIFVPQRINNLFCKSTKSRGKYPIGVRKEKGRNKFSSCCKVFDQCLYLGEFNSPTEAFYAYKEKKEQYIKQIADIYKNSIPKKLYDAMYNYKVEIID